MQVFKDTGITENIRVVVSNDTPFKPEAVDSAIAAIGYAAKEYLMLTESVTGEGQVMSHVMILDLNIPLHSTNSSYIDTYFGDFIEQFLRYLCDGVYHRGCRKTFGKFGKNVKVSIVNLNPVRKVTISFETSMTDEEINDAFCKLGLIGIAVK